MRSFLHRSKARTGASAWKGKLHEISRDPFTDWVLILAVSLIAALSLLIAGASAYVGVDDASRAPVASGASRLPSVDTRALNSVLGQFNSRAAERTALLGGYEGPGDPSL